MIFICNTNKYHQGGEMMKKPTFDKLDEIFEHITSLRLTDREYADKTGASLPKRTSYLVNESAFSR